MQNEFFEQKHIDFVVRAANGCVTKKNVFRKIAIKKKKKRKKEKKKKKKRQYLNGKKAANKMQFFFVPFFVFIIW